MLTMSCAFFAANAGFATSTLGNSARTAIGVNALAASYGIFGYRLGTTAKLEASTRSVAPSGAALAT